MTYGVWDNSHLKASEQQLIGLNYVAIQAQEFSNRVTHTIHQCPAIEFKEFRWHGASAMPLMNMGQAAYTIEPKIVGLSLVRKNEHITSFFQDGTLMRKEP